MRGDNSPLSLYPTPKWCQMRKRFNPSDLLPVKARFNQRLVQVGRKYYLSGARRRYTSDEMAEEKIVEKLHRVIKKEYKDNINLHKKKIDSVLGDVYVVIPHYPESSISDIIILIEKMPDKPTDIVAAEICKHLKI